MVRVHRDEVGVLGGVEEEGLAPREREGPLRSRIDDRRLDRLSVALPAAARPEELSDAVDLAILDAGEGSPLAGR
jgi:hypothetical protein